MTLTVETWNSSPVIKPSGTVEMVGSSSYMCAEVGDVCAFVTFPFTCAPPVYSEQVFKGNYVEASAPPSDFGRPSPCILD